MKFFGYSKLTQDQAKLFIINCYMGVLRRYPEKDVLERESQEIASGNKSCSEFLTGVIYSKEFKSIVGTTDFLDPSKSYIDIEYKNQGQQERIKNLIYFGFAVNRPIGGMKVIFHHANLINSISDNSLNAQVFFPETSHFNITWMNIKIDTKKDHLFDVAKDFVIIPEVLAWYYGRKFKNACVRYAIFVQNGYLIFNEINGADKKKLIELQDIYESADIILSISDNVTSCIKSIYPQTESQILQLKASVNKNLFFPDKNKKNIITYMPRKLAAHASWVFNHLSSKIPKNWEIVPVNNMTEDQVAHALNASKIFMSFSDQEGLGLPPLEAAMSGNKVIGYTGQAGKEYWKGCIFQEIECGDLISFAEAVLAEVQKLDEDSAVSFYPNFLKEMTELGNLYSKHQEELALRELIMKISKL